jgi:hypothetical protein
VWFVADHNLVSVQRGRSAEILPLGRRSLYAYGYLGPEPLAVDPAGLVWLSGPQGWQVIDPAKGYPGTVASETVARFSSPSDAFGGMHWALAFGGGYAWVQSLTHGFRIQMFDLRTHRVVGPAIPTPANTFALAYAPTGTLWALTGQNVTAIRGPHAGFTQPIPIPVVPEATANEPATLSIDAKGGLWVGTAKGLVVPFDASGHPTGPPIDIGQGTTQVATAGNAILVLDTADHTLTSIRTVGAGRGVIQARVRIPGATSPSTLSWIPRRCVITDQRAGADQQTSEVIEASF